MKKYLSYILIITSLLISCSPDIDLESGEQPEHIPAGAYEEDCKWIYAQMNHDYYWRKDMPDSLSCDYGTDPVTFYKSLLSEKDRFSYCENNQSYTGITESANYGFEYQNYSIGEMSFSQVLYVWDENVKKKGINRGDIFKFIDDKTISRGTISEGEFLPSDTILLSYNPLGNSNSVYLDSIYCISDKRVGYLCYLEFDDIKELEPVLKRFFENHVDELVLDLRYNPGGYVSTCKFLTNSIVSEDAYGKVFQYCTYNDVLTMELFNETGMDKSVSYYLTPNNGIVPLGNDLFGLNLKRVFVLTSRYSASASEAAIICLKPFMDVIIIGEQTYGKGVGSWTIRDNRFKYQIQPITMRYHNANMESTPDDGIPVDYLVEDGYSTSKKDLGDTSEPLLMKALDIISNNVVQTRSIDNKSIVSNGNIIRQGAPSFFNIKIKDNEKNPE